MKIDNKFAYIYLGIVGMLTTTTVIFAYKYFITSAILNEYANTLFECVGRLI